jgi:hypothetical protein
MIENWLDAVCKVFGTISNGKGGQVKAYRVFEQGEIPSVLTEYPCAVTYVPEAEPMYTSGAITSLIWSGETELHIAAADDPALLPDVMKYFTRVLLAVTAARTLNGKVQYFLLPEGQKSIRMSKLQYGSGPFHYGLVVMWEVKENIGLNLSG